MSRGRRVTFLLDVDNTLLDNDRVQQDLKRHLDEAFGVDCRREYWEIFETLRNELGYTDYLGALQRYRIEHPRNPRILEISSFLIDYGFADRLYPQALKVIERVQTFGPTVILSDGDAVFQPRKIARSGIWKTVDGHVLVYVHKEQMLEDIEKKYPADHYVMVDDKVRILAAMKETWKDRVTTVFVRQGHYAEDQRVRAQHPAVDLELENIGALMGPDISTILSLATKPLRSQR